MSSELTFVQAGDTLAHEYEKMAERSFGHTVGDITHLHGHADIRVAVRSGKVIAGGLGLLLPQYFGGAPVPSALLAAGSVAPEERGNHLAARMVHERLRPLRERGAVISSISTLSNGYARHLGWQAPVAVYAHAVHTDDLKRSFDAGDFRIETGSGPEALDLQQDLARHWNGPVQRPAWWEDWKTAKNSLTTYSFHRPGAPISGWLSITTSRRERHGTDLTVHDFWAHDHECAAAMLAFLGRYNSRADTVHFRRGALPPTPLLLHNLHRYQVTTRAWHPWMLRILDPRGAVRLRGWPHDLDLELLIEIGEAAPRTTHRRYLLRICAGAADLTPARDEGQVTLTNGQFAAWYAGGLRSPEAARLSGIRARSDASLAAFIRVTANEEPWLPDHF
ncbi:enhanced intracellular survival protein Eis [Streptomyces sp. CBMA123]|uniref:GNAT family N-acetyltransferase n=1 Tax=Streptomyces sp. CBMA123 TaxID=1896313 RepID=UPI001DE7B6E8|nr:GNAT family N-acetyltransferase [Streptomyces sp. CBMA123]MBD0693925.1 spore coat protein [Streptomyces sp. CBMA123]